MPDTPVPPLPTPTPTPAPPPAPSDTVTLTVSRPVADLLLPFLRDHLLPEIQRAITALQA